jgi:hypothetical protein
VKDKKKFDKYEYYTKAVQSPDVDVKFIRSVYKELKGKNPKTFREDFCGTFALSRSWVKLDKQHKAIGVDLDREPITYGRAQEAKEMSEEQQRRLTILNKNVMAPDLPGTDIVGAFNFSYYIFKTRKDMKKYFQNVYSRLGKDGVFTIDCFGGTQSQEPNIEETDHGAFKYYWDQDSFDPVTGLAKFYIHFKLKGKKKLKKVFSYDWRIWNVPELRELLEEVGFKKTHVYWEGTTKKGGGDGVFKRTEVGEDCDSWICYVAAEK